MDRNIAVLESGRVYRNRGGGEYMCVTPTWLDYPAGEARMRNVKPGWTFRAHGIQMYPDGTIEWDYSSGGYSDETAQKE